LETVGHPAGAINAANESFQLNSRFVVPGQTVDATPSGIKLFSKVVFMRPGRRFGLSAEQKCDVWRRWKAGQTLHEIGRAFGKDHNSIRGVVARHGGMVPAVRRRALLALTLRERAEISRGLASGSSFREIAKCLERAVSTVSREVAGHGGRPAYRASQADGEAWQSALRPKRCLLSINLKLRNIVASKLILDWSPKQISGWLKTQYPDVMRACVCPTKPFTEACSFSNAVDYIGLIRKIKPTVCHEKIETHAKRIALKTKMHGGFVAKRRFL
jgi:hypothetical protein